jgi:hypothetical protein
MALVEMPTKSLEAGRLEGTLGQKGSLEATGLMGGSVVKFRAHWCRGSHGRLGNGVRPARLRLAAIGGRNSRHRAGIVKLSRLTRTEVGQVVRGM